MLTLFDGCICHFFYIFLAYTNTHTTKLFDRWNIYTWMGFVCLGNVEHRRSMRGGQTYLIDVNFVAQVTAWYWAWSDADKWFPSNFWAKQFVSDVETFESSSENLLTSIDWQNQIVSGAFCRKPFLMKTLLYGSKMNWPVLLQSSRSGFSLGCQMWGD